ncbi:hypothetical protein MARINOS108_11356 [Marinoscillum sp. 108]|nr:hypothetical protein MARINOS108_11356 [Marinoscillum sp. 108]
MSPYLFYHITIHYISYTFPNTFFMARFRVNMTLNLTLYFIPDR